ncbi:Gfo/Idh/MocA family oxidoreductase [Solicola sp. PLA-1-18]|uniref:Gfo/Idh/MocA family oxidoreductase n=1 Tax=Solicola sp. PLA-1-18 TaxID=3380532 RepID=UPI003B7AD572
MSLRIGVVGAGAMGSEHVRVLSAHVPAARVTMVYDADAERADHVAGSVSAKVAGSGEELVRSDDVDAVVIASPDFTHADLVRTCIDARKQVLCEKPLALTSEESAGVVEAEAAAGRRYVQVGFMRRFDPGFVALRQAALGGAVGIPRMVHCVHRNAVSHTSTSSDNLITGSMIHELDTVRWLLGEEIVSIDVRSPVADGFADPQLAVIEMASGTLVTVEVFVNAHYGYDVGCEVVGTRGTTSLAAPQLVTHKRAGADETPIGDSFVARFADAYRIELNEWVEAALGGTPTGPTAWDGHVANVVASAGIASLHAGSRQGVELPPVPRLYAS